MYGFTRALDLLKPRKISRFRTEWTRQCPGAAFKPRSLVYHAGYALVIVGVAVALYTSRDVAPIFGHLNPSAGAAHR